MQWKINLAHVICLRMWKTTEAKLHRVNLRSPLPRIHYYQNKRLQVKESQYLISTYNWTLTPIPNWTCFVVTISHFQCTAPSTWLTNQCTDPTTWLIPQQPFNCCSWFAATSHRNTNKIFNVGAGDFAWLQNPKAYKKHSKNSFFCRRRLGFQKENLMKLSRVRFFLFPPPLNRSLMGSPIPNRFTQTLGFPSLIRIIQNP